MASHDRDRDDTTASPPHDGGGGGGGIRFLTKKRDEEKVEDNTGGSGSRSGSDTSLSASNTRITIADKAEAVQAEIPGAPGLPQLNYNLWDHRRKLIIISTLLVLELSILPISLYYGLWFGTTLRHGILFAIITSFFGIVTGIEYTLRSWRLLQPADTFRPLGSSRLQLDFTHWTLTVAYGIMTALLVGASIPYEPLVRPLAMPLSLFLLQMAAQLLWSGWMSAGAGGSGRPAPFRVSSIARGSPMRPLVYTLMEDVVAVDGAAGRSYRERLVLRYEASMYFRRLVAGLNWFWGAGALVVGAGTLIVVWTVPEAVAYGVGWGSPLVFTMLWTAITFVWLRHALTEEKCLWATGEQRRAEP